MMLLDMHRLAHSFCCEPSGVFHMIKLFLVVCRINSIHMTARSKNIEVRILKYVYRLVLNPPYKVLLAYKEPMTVYAIID